MKNLHSIQGVIPPEVLAWCWGHKNFMYQYHRDTKMLFFLRYGEAPGVLRSEEQILHWYNDFNTLYSQSTVPSNLEII